MSRTYRKLEDYPTGERDPEDIRYEGDAVKRHNDAQRLRSSKHQWLPKQWPVIDPEWDNE